MPLDIALAYDAVNRRSDVVFNGVDFALDSTWLTPVLMSLGCNRRAHPDDQVPSNVVAPAQNTPLLNDRGGSPCDSLDTNGELTGSRMWIFFRSKLGGSTVAGMPGAMLTPVLAKAVVDEALSWRRRVGVPMTIDVQRYDKNTLATRITVGTQTIVVPQVIGA